MRCRLTSVHLALAVIVMVALIPEIARRPNIALPLLGTTGFLVRRSLRYATPFAIQRSSQARRSAPWKAPWSAISGERTVKLRVKTTPSTPPWHRKLRRARLARQHQRLYIKPDSAFVMRIALLLRHLVNVRTYKSICQAMVHRLHSIVITVVTHWRIATTTSNRASSLTHCGPQELAVFVAALNERLQPIIPDAHVVAVEQSTRQLTLVLTPHTPLNRAQQRQLADSLRGVAASIRWVTATSLRIGLPLAIPLDTRVTLCVPILRQHRTTLWWSLASMRHLVLVGDATPALSAILQSLNTIAEHQPLTLALHDPEGELQTFTPLGLTPMPDALVAARLHALRATWGMHQHQPAPLEPPLILVVVAPDALAWRDLMPLLQDTSQAVHILLLLSAGEASDEARDACHQVPVLEVGGLAVALPESHRPPGLGEPRAGAAQAWRPDHLVWRGTPIKPGTL